MKDGEKSVAAGDGLYRSVRKVIEEGRKVVSIAANAVLVRQNWSIGKLIVEDDPIAREWYMNECDETDAAIARYSVLHDNKNMFAVKYSTVMPSDEILRRKIETQKELYRLQMQSEAMPERKRPIRAKKKGGRK